jgi:hypothetical protein
MATVLGLAMKITADASGLQKSLTPVDRALQRLGEQSSASAAQFDKFLGSTTGAAAAQRQFATDVAFLTSELKRNLRTPQEFAAEFEKLQQAARATADAFAEGARLTEETLTAEERRAAKLERINELLQLGAMKEEAAARAKAIYSGETEKAAAAERSRISEMARLQAEADAITEKYLNDVERRARATERFNTLLGSGKITEETHARAIADVSGATAAAARAEDERNAALAEGVRLQQQYGDQTKIVADEIARWVGLQESGALDLFALNNAAIERLGIDKQAAASARQRAESVAESERRQADAYTAARAAEAAAAAEADRQQAAFLQRAAQLQEQARTPMQRYDAEVQELLAHKKAFNLTTEQFNILLGDATQRFVRAESAAKGYDAAVEQAGKKGNLAFNELAGTLAVLPGPIGNVAGRLSGISSAAEGLNRIFSNGGGIGQFGAAIAGLVNPTTLALGGLAAFGAGAVAVGRGLVQLEGEVERLGQLAERLGVSFGFVQVLETAANQTGTSVEALGGSFTKFLRSVDDARDGGKNAAAAFKTLGLSTEDVRNADPETLFTQAAQAIAKIEDPAKRAATAAALFGKSGAELLPVFRQLGAAAADLDRVGNILTDQQRAQIDLFGDSLDRLGVATQGFGRQLTVSFSSGATGAVDALAEIIGSINSFTKAASAAAEGPLKALRNALLATGLFKPLDELDDGKNRLDEVRQAAERLKQVEVANIVTVDQFEAAQRLAKTLDDLKAASEDFGANQELAAAAAGKAIDLFSKEAEAAGMSADNIKAFADSADADFKRFIDGINRVADESKKAAEEREQAVQRLIQADAQRADAFIRQNGLSNENEAAENLLAITRQIDEAETAIVQARAKGDAEAGKAAMRRLQILDQAQAAAQDTLDFGFNANDIQQAIRGAQDEMDAVIAKAGEFGQAGVQAGLEFQRGLEKAKAQLEGELIDPKGFDAAIQKQQQLFNDRIQRLEEIRNLELQILEERASVEEDRLAALRRTAQQPLQVADIRTQEGASELVRLATGREDPAIEEYRKQLDQLRKLEAKLDRLGAVPVEIMGG